MPYWLWKVLPEVFADKLPNRPGNGYERLGFTYETPTSDLPMGATRSDDWVPRVGLNCATCHAGAYREAPGAAAEDRAGDARASDGSPGLCAVPVRRCQGSAVQRRHAHRGHAEASGVRLLRRPGLQVVRDQPHEGGHPRAGPAHRLVRQAAAAGSGPRRHVQSVQGDVRRGDELRHRRHRRHRRSAVALEPADAPGIVAALGRQQQLGRRAQQERGDRRRRDAGFPRSRGARSDRQLDSRSEAAAVSRRRASTPRWRRRAGRSTSSTARAATTSASRRSARRSTSPRSAPIRSGCNRSRRSWRSR